MKILILGSHGFIGRQLFEHLVALGHEVRGFDITQEPSQDLRIKGALDSYLEKAELVYFLSFDVGGAKYLQTAQNDFGFIASNLRMMTNGFESLEKAGIPFVFLSTHMSEMPHSIYGHLKWIGEAATQALGGVNVRCWNIYGNELLSLRSHVVTDFVHSALARGEIRMLTDGSEFRQFLSVEDCVRFLGMIPTLKWAELLDTPLHLTSFKWTSIRELADLITEIIPGVRVVPSEQKDTLHNSITMAPDTTILKFWKPEIGLKLGLTKLVNSYRSC